MICPNCGCECDDNLMFCTKCGTKINSFENDISATPIDNTYDNILGGIKIESGEENTEQLLNNDEHSEDELLEDDLLEGGSKFDGKYISSLQSDYKVSSRDYSKKKNIKKKKITKKQILFTGLITVVLVVIAVFSTLMVKKTVMTKKFNQYYNSGESYLDEKNYEYAKSQFILASGNAFTKEQKIKAYEKVYEVDGILGGYDEEQIHYLELLIDEDENNIDYYKELIILYQNNNMDSKIDALVNSAPSSLKSELENYDGIIPTVDVKEGTYDKPIEIKLNASGNVKIYYTLDGSDPTDSDTKKEYIEPISLATEGTYTLRAYSIDENNQESKECNFKYILKFKTVDAPAISLKSGEYSTREKITVTVPDGCKVYYTTDGTVPTKKDKLYTKSFRMPKSNSVYYFIAIDEEGIASDVVTRAYNYVPNKISYDSAVNSLTDYLVSVGIYDNDYGENNNGDIGYTEYKDTVEINYTEFYIINIEIKDKKGNNKSITTYAVSCESGAVSEAVKNGNSYSLK
jgi:hypothetical protein